MILYYANNTDITASVQLGSLSIQEQANNRRNTARFVVNGTEISEAVRVDIYKAEKISALVNAGASSVSIPSLDTTCESTDAFRPGTLARLGIKTANEEVLEVDSYSPLTGVLAFVTPTRYSHAKNEYVGKKLYSGVTLKNPREEIGKSDIISCSVDCSDLSTLFDTHNVVDTFVEKYAREIIGRVVYLGTADDDRLNFSDMESVGTISASGVAVTPTLDTGDKVYKNASVNIGSTGAGVATYTITPGGTFDASSMDRLRLWLKMPTDYANWTTGFRVRAISSAGNYWQWDDAVLANKLWSYDSFDFSRSTIVGSPVKNTITAVEVSLTATKAVPVGTFKIDHVFFSRGGFSLRGVQGGNIFFKDVRSQYKKPTVLVESLAKNEGFFWFVDYDGDIKYFDSSSRPAPFSIVAPTGKNYGNLKITADITNLKNRQVVRGGIAPSDFLYEQKHVCDGKETSYRLDYPPKTLSIDVDMTGGGTFVSKTVGVENLVSDTSVDFVFNFSEKTLRNGAISVLPAGAVIRLTYYPYKDVRVSVKDDASIAAMKALLGGDGIFDGAVINDASFRTFDEARVRAKAELKAYANPILTATFSTETEGLEIGQIIRINDPSFDIDKDFVVQKIDKKVNNLSGRIVHSVQAGTTLFGLTEFFQYLLKLTGTGEIDTGELVDNVQGVDEVLVVTDTFQSKKKSNVFYAHARNGVYSFGLTFTEGGTANDAYADFSVAS